MNPGDVVRLKSGGKSMTVRFEVTADATLATGYRVGILCNWHDDAGVPREESFLAEQLISAMAEQ